MIIFYTKDIANNIAVLVDQEAIHCSKVLRNRVGDEVVFTDGLGYMYNGVIKEIGKKKCEIEIISKEKGAALDYELAIAISPVKNSARFEWFLEKATEIGVTRIIPIICERTQRNKLKYDRLQNIINSAAKQSLKSTFPILEESIKFKDFIEGVNPSEVFLAHLMEDSIYLGSAITPKSCYTLLIGPEGDFTDSEIELCMEKGIIPVTLGGSRLRTETAGVVATQIVNTIHELNILA